jgi:tetratricopeptide (TPR) repeat protein
MRSCILAFYLGTAASTAAQSSDPEALYRAREDMAQARRAADLWAADLGTDARHFDAAWKLARISYWIGTHAEPESRRASLERGRAAGERAIALAPNRPEGHFWLAANMGGLAESFGLMQGLKYRGRIKSELERVIAIDPLWQQASGERALGWWYHRVPGLFGGSEAKAEAHLRQALSVNPRSIISWYFLAEVLKARGRNGEALAALRMVIDLPPDPAWEPEDRDFKEKARGRLDDWARQ